MLTEYKGFKWKVLNAQKKSGKVTYTIEKIAGDWPYNNDLITLCDGGIPDVSVSHFGGHVNYTEEGGRVAGNKAIVTVYID